ncbi:MAG: dephospho-CoA kinase [Betaproteobacteria bacterium]|nr:dephospho-CoA kinase [Betaproteobacteria bacterium]
MKLLLFGQIGSGKSFVGECLQRDFGIHYHDADDDLPQAMVEAVRSHQPITEAMRNEFTEVIIARIGDLSQRHADFCLAQALFKNRHRLRILTRCPTAVPVWIRSTDALIGARLLERTGHLASAYYAEKINPGFEAPTMPHQAIDNFGDDAALHAQLQKLVERFGTDS